VFINLLRSLNSILTSFLKERQNLSSKKESSVKPPDPVKDKAKKLMMELVLKRISMKPEFTQGVLLNDKGIGFALTLERPWINNIMNISCIPAGEYVCNRYTSSRYSNTFQVVDVPNRTYILFHSGNTISDSAGCIMIGEEFGYLDGRVAILSSNRGFKEFLKVLSTVSEFRLIIKEV